MKEPIFEKLRSVERTISHEKGDFILFAIFLREDAPDVWDLVVAAPWIQEKKNEALQYLVSQIKKYLKPSELIKISRIVIVDPSDAPVQAINRAIGVEHGDVEVNNSNFFGLHIAQAVIITSKPAVAPAA